MTAAALPTIDKTVKIIVSGCLMALYVLPVEFTDLYVGKGGRYNGIDAFSVFLCIAGLYYSWRYIGEIIIGLNVLGIVASGLFYSHNGKSGFLINLCVNLVSLACLCWLRHLYKSDSKQAS